MEIKTDNKNDIVTVSQDMVSSVIEQRAKETKDVKATIDLVATKTALEKDGTIDKIVTEKTEELKNDAEAKRIQAETEKIKQEVDRVKQEGEKAIAELEQKKNQLQAEVEQMNKEADKAQAYFEANKDILKCVNIRTKKSLKVMQGWMYPASFIFAILQIVTLPITICGAILEGIINIVGGVCGSIKNNALKITISIIVVLILSASIIGSIFGVKAIFNFIK